MSEPTKKGLVPVLRFPEFREAGEWEKKQLVGVCKMQAGKFVSASEIKEQINGGLHPCYGGNGLRGFTKTYTHAGRYSLIGRQGALCGNITLATGKFHATEHAVVVTPSKGVDTNWLFYMLGYLNLNQYATGQAQPGLSVENLEKISINIPDDDEQQKIADCLSSIDELVTAQTQKVEGLKAHKKGLMQQLFPAEGETVPKLRFPEFRDTGEWDKKNLGELAIFLKGKGLPKSVITRDGKNLCVHYGELFTEYSEVIANINSRTDLYDGCFFSVENDVLMPTSDVTPNGLAKACCIKFDGVILGGDILVIRTDKTVINGEFISRQIRHLEQKVLQLVSGSTVFHLYASSIEKLALRIPSFKEQQKIADCLSSIDELVTAQTQKVEALKAHKEGLMQQLFPAPIEE